MSINIQITDHTSSFISFYFGLSKDKFNLLFLVGDWSKLPSQPLRYFSSPSLCDNLLLILD